MATKIALAYARRALQGDVDRAADNLYRAEAAFRGLSPQQMDVEYGSSGNTCGAILRDYREHHKKLKNALEELHD